MSRLSRRAGSALVGVLLVLSLLLVMGVGLLSQKANQYDEMRRANQSTQARALAQAGLVDARLKLSKDPSFPPARPSGDAQFTYSQNITTTSGQLAGSYTVVVDSTKNQPPYHVIRVTSVGLVGSRVNPDGRYSIYGELDASRFMRDDPTTPNPNFYRWALVREQSRPVDLIIPTPP